MSGLSCTEVVTNGMNRKRQTDRYVEDHVLLDTRVADIITVVHTERGKRRKSANITVTTTAGPYNS
jgi:hypothetical protein